MPPRGTYPTRCTPAVREITTRKSDPSRAAGAAFEALEHVVGGKTYQYRVRAAGAGDSSPWSGVAPATTPQGPIVASLFSSRRIGS